MDSHPVERAVCSTPYFLFFVFSFFVILFLKYGVRTAFDLPV